MARESPPPFGRDRPSCVVSPNVSKFAVAALTLCLFAAPVAAMAGTTGELAGIVTDLGGRPVVGATVAASSAAQVATTKSDATGRFIFIALVPGSYLVAVSCRGFMTTVYPGRQVYADLESLLEARLASRMRVLAMLDEFHWEAWFGGMGVHADGYRMTRGSTPFYDLGDRVTGALQFVPGVTFGSGAVLQY